MKDCFSDIELVNYLNGELEKADRDRLETHITQCEECQAQLAEFSQVVNIVSAVEVTETASLTPEQVETIIAKSKHKTIHLRPLALVASLLLAFVIIYSFNKQEVVEEVIGENVCQHQGNATTFMMHNRVETGTDGRSKLLISLTDSSCDFISKNVVLAIDTSSKESITGGINAISNYIYNEMFIDHGISYTIVITGVSSSTFELSSSISSPQQLVNNIRKIRLHGASSLESTMDAGLANARHLQKRYGSTVEVKLFSTIENQLKYQQMLDQVTLEAAQENIKLFCGM